MYQGLHAFAAAALVASAFGIAPSFAQKSGGIHRMHAIDSPPNLANAPAWQGMEGAAEK
jgi:hypothetical protein